jgi:hypothetical protein
MLAVAPSLNSLVWHARGSPATHMALAFYQSHPAGVLASCNGTSNFWATILTTYLLTYLLYRSFPALPGGSGGGAASPLRVLVVKIVQLSNCPIPQFGVTFSFLFFSFRALESGEARTQNPEPIIAQ